MTAAGNDGCYVPGKSFEDYRIFNAAKLIPAGSDVRVQIHYTPSGKESVDRPEIGVTIAKQPPERIYVTSGMSAPGDRKVFAIPPNDPNWLSPPAEATFDADAEIVWMMPHMHVRGKDMTYTLVYPDGRQEIILNVPRYDFNWQLGYNLAKPVKVTERHEADRQRALRQLAEQQVQSGSEPDRVHGDDDLGRDDVPVLQRGRGQGRRSAEGHQRRGAAPDGADSSTAAAGRDGLKTVPYAKRVFGPFEPSWKSAVVPLHEAGVGHALQGVPHNVT